MTDLAPCGQALAWRGLYSGQYDLWTPESYQHPAKMAPGLAFRILQHLKELGLLQDGGTVLDPMGGIGTTGLCASLLGHPAILVELEEKFVKLAQANAERIALKGVGPPIRVIQGDARHLSELLAEKGMVSVISPPYVGDGSGAGRAGPTSAKWKGIRFDSKIPPIEEASSSQEGYGQTPGQIGNLPDTPIVITSPPYGDNQEKGGGIDWNKANRPDRLRASERRHNVDGLNPEGYGSTPGQIGALPDVAITSPPYANFHPWSMMPEDLDQYEKERLIKRQAKLPTRSRVGFRGHYGDPRDKTNIGNLPDTVTLTSPPYEGTQQAAIETDRASYQRRKKLKAGQHHGTSGGFSAHELLEPQSEGQIGQERQEHYLEAMKRVYAEIAKVSPVLVVVVKDPTRNGKLRLLGEDTARLLEQCGYRIVDYHRSILFEEQEQGHLFEGSLKQPRGRLGFFKRLAYRKGSPVAQFEHVLIGMKEGVSLPLKGEAWKL